MSWIEQILSKIGELMFEDSEGVLIIALIFMIIALACQSLILKTMEEDILELQQAVFGKHGEEFEGELRDERKGI